MRRHQAIIVGGGPAGLSAAKALRAEGIDDVLVIEREDSAGGLPRDCDHGGFGLGQYHRFYTGPAYAQRLLGDVAGVPLMTRSSVVELAPGGVIAVASEAGVQQMSAPTVLLATGIREMPRPGRLVSGGRPAGLLTTGALQRWLRDAGAAPCRRPVIVGSEWVAFSALLTLRRAGVRAVAMIEERERVTIPVAAAALARAWFSVPVATATRIVRVLGNDRVEGVEIERDGERRTMECDAVIFTGRFVPEAALVRGSHLLVDPGSGGPLIDQHFRCSDPAYFAAGNVLRAVQTSGVVGREGAAAGRAMAAALQGRLCAPERRVLIGSPDPLAYVCPRAIAVPDGALARPVILGARVTRAVRGTLRVMRNGECVAHRRITALPDRLFPIRLPRDFRRGLESLLVRIDEPPTASGVLAATGSTS
jgi:NADPH-dependent 2,4-dienoyl-CoA reductase/sulfur reductase-like enzyme